jgi:hypothetical protein
MLHLAQQLKVIPSQLAQTAAKSFSSKQLKTTHTVAGKNRQHKQMQGAYKHQVVSTLEVEMRQALPDGG